MDKNIYAKLSKQEQDIYLKYCLPDDLSKLKLQSVILSDDNKRKIVDFIVETNNKVKFMQHGLEPVNRLIFYGASGTGKTYLTKCLAAHFNYELLAIDIANALSAGNAPIAIEEIFKLGNKIGKCIIFLDECDAIARDRASKTSNEDGNVRRANNALFQQLDRMNPECIFISATNMYNELDKAFLRRFNIKMKFDRPPIDDIDEHIRKFLLPDFTIVEDMEDSIKSTILYQSRNYTHLSYDEIQTWVERAEKRAIIDGSTDVLESVIYEHFMNSLGLQIKYDSNCKPYLHKVAL